MADGGVIIDDAGAQHTKITREDYGDGTQDMHELKAKFPHVFSASLYSVKVKWKGAIPDEFTSKAYQRCRSFCLG